MKARIRRLVARAQQTMPARVLMAYGESQASNFALALAFAGFMSMFPMMVGALAIIGLAVRDPVTEAHLQSLIVQMFPGSAQAELHKALDGVKQSAGVFGVLSICGLLWSASSIFSTMEFALTEIFGTKQRDMIRQRAMGLLMILVLVIAIVLTMLVNGFAAFLPFAWLWGFVIGALVMVGLLVVLYRFVPNRTFRLREVLPGAVLAGVGIELLTFAFPLYVRIAGGFNTYGATFALFFLLATWFYLLSQLILLGAVFNKFRLGQPHAEGIIASPMQESREKNRANEAIEARRSAPAEPAQPRPAPRSIFQRVALGGVLALAMAAGVVRRRRPRTSS